VASFSNIVSRVGNTVNTVKRATNLIQNGATIAPDLVKNLTQGSVKSGLDTLIGLASPNGSAGTPPYENILEQFASFSSLWTLACLEPNQFNNPSSYRNNISSLQNIVFSSAGRYDGQRVRTARGSPEYFINDFEFDSVIAPTQGTGNTNVIKFNFTVYEPYSMGLFLQSLQVAAVNSGYSSYLESAPYVLKLDIQGNTDDGTIINDIETLTKYFTIKITNVTMSVDEGGSKYAVTAVPYHHLGFSDVNNTVKTNVRLTGTSIKDVLVESSDSLIKKLNEEQEELVDSGDRFLPDIFEIVFPTDSSDDLGVQSSSASFDFATFNPLRSVVNNVISGNQTTQSIDPGNNAISDSTMNFSANIGGNFVYPKESQTINSQAGKVDRSKVTTDPNAREFRFDQGDKITEIIQKIILVSNYATSAIDPSNLDSDGMASWFRLDVQIQLLDYDAKRNTRAKKYVYRIIPYKVNGSVLKHPSAPAPGLPEIAKKIAKRYDYIYTGRNNNILKFELEFNGMFFTGAFPRPPERTGTNNSDTQNVTDTEKLSAPVNAGGSGSSKSVTGSSTVQPDTNTVKSSPVGNKTVQQQIADAYQNAFLNASRDLINIEIEILGDPYFLSDSGINSNYFSQPGENFLITADNAMNYEGSEIFIYLAFRTPVEPNLSVSKEGGLYDFPESGVSPFSGIYKVIKVVNKFANGNYTQTMNLVRIPGQENDIEGWENIVLENLFLFKEPVPIAPESTPASDPISASQENVEGSVVETEDVTERLLSQAENASNAARENQRPSASATSAVGPDPLLLQDRPDFTSNIPEIRRRAGLD